MRDAYQRQTLGTDWFENLCSAARWLLRAAHKQPYSSETAQLLEPVGIDTDAQPALCSWELGSQIHDAKADEAMKEITDAELAGVGATATTYGHAKCHCRPKPLGTREPNVGPADARRHCLHDGPVRAMQKR
jgi:hypothetical protein